MIADDVYSISGISRLVFDQMFLICMLFKVLNDLYSRHYVTLD